MLYTIKIKSIEVLAKHGVYDNEKQKSQRFIVDCFFDILRDNTSDSINSTVDYSEVVRSIVRFVRHNSFDLIETLSDKLCAQLLLDYPQMQSIKIEVKKPDAKLDAKVGYVAVESNRARTSGVYVGLGSNLGDRESIIYRALKLIDSRSDCKVLRTSSIYETKPYGKTNQPDFLNAIAEIQTTLSPTELLHLLKQIERAEGRDPNAEHWGPRILDLDIILFGDAIYNSPSITIPHPDLANRKFVLMPLCELADNLMHPTMGVNMKALLTKCK